MICTIVLCSDACIFIKIQRSCSILGFFTSSPNLFVALNNFRFLSVISGYSRNPFFILELTGVFVGGFQFKLATYGPNTFNRIEEDNDSYPILQAEEDHSLSVHHVLFLSCILNFKGIKLFFLGWVSSFETAHYSCWYLGEN